MQQKPCTLTINGCILLVVVSQTLAFEVAPQVPPAGMHLSMRNFVVYPRGRFHWQGIEPLGCRRLAMVWKLCRPAYFPFRRRGFFFFLRSPLSLPGSFSP